MVAWTNNIWEVRAHDGRDRAHVPSQPVWSAVGMRLIQLLLAFIILVMTAYAASQFGTGDLAGFGLAWFTFILTFGYIIYLGVSLFSAPHAYNYWAQLALESLCVIFWLCTFAVLASEASQLSPINDYYGSDYLGSNWTSAINCMTASAVLGALLWLTFVITLGFFVLALLSHRKTAAHSTTGAFGDKPVVDGPVNATELQQPQQAYQQPHQDSPYDQQQTYPVEQQQAYHAGEQQPQAYPVDHQQQAYAVPEHQQAAYAVPEQQQQAHIVPEHKEPYQQV